MANQFSTYLSVSGLASQSHQSTQIKGTVSMKRWHLVLSTYPFLHSPLIAYNTSLLVQGDSTLSKYAFINTVLREKDLPSHSSH